MTNLVERPSSGKGRGARRRDQLIDAGVELLAERGWPAVTTRAVAERAGANLGLIHYHFGGLQALRLAIAERAGEVIIGPVLAGFLGAPDERAALEALRRVIPETTGDTRVVKLATELITEGFRDPVLGEMSRDQLRVAREQIAERLARLRPEWSRERRLGAAVLVAALLDGLMLHRLLDAELPTDHALTALADLLGVES